jgi:hypothetical protein
VRHEGKVKYLIVVEDKDGEAIGYKYHFGYNEEREPAEKMLSALRLMLPRALKLYSEFDFNGVFLPCAYLSESSSVSQAGYMMYVWSGGRPNRTTKSKPIDGFEKQFGPGSTDMIPTFWGAHIDTWKSFGLGECAAADFDFACRSHCELMALDFLVVDSQIVCLKNSIDEDDPVLVEAARAGIERVYWMPSYTTTLRK